jgi:hypothetical protein
MKRINLTENDIFNIVNRVIAEQNTQTTTKELTDEEKIKRFISGDSTGPGLKDEMFKLTDKRGLNKDLMQFIVKNVELFDTQSKGTAARVKGIIYGQSQPETEETVFELICGSFGDFKLVKYKGMDGIQDISPKEEKPKEEKPKEDLGRYENPDSIKQKELSLPRNEKGDSTYERFEYIREPFQAQTDDIEEYAGVGVLIYITNNERLKNKINTNNEWFNFYDKSGKVKSVVKYYDNVSGVGGQSHLVYLYATEQNSNNGVKELVNTIKSQFVNDLNFYGIKERKKFNLDEITDKSRNVKVYKTQGKDNKNYNIILLAFK